MRLQGKNMGKILLFYKYIHIENPEEIQVWFRDLCTELNLTGRILLAHEGINGTVGGSDKATAIFIEKMNNHSLFFDMDIKEAPGDETFFPRMRIVIKNTIVNLGIDPKILTTKNTGVHLTPKEAHNLLNEKPEDLVIIDTRNNYEARVGTIPGSMIPDKRYFREFPEYIEEQKENLKNKQVLMFCSGGIRCERASAYIKEQGIAKEVYQIKGGIHRYIEQFPDGHFKGTYYVFDGRVGVKVTDDILTNCDLCNIPCDFYVNCMNGRCNKQFIGCPSCIKDFAECCSLNCQKLVDSKEVPLRKKPVISVDQRFELLKESNDN